MEKTVRRPAKPSEENPFMLTKNELVAYSERLNGSTYAEIASILGVSAQRACELHLKAEIQANRISEHGV